MKRLLALTTLLTLLALPSLCLAKAGLPDFTDLAERTGKAVVNISTTKKVAGGIQVVNSSLVDPELVDKSGRIRTLLVPANELAEKVGNARAVNTIMLGAYVAATGMVKLSTVEECLSAVMPAKIVPLNVTALRAGAEHVQEQLKALASCKESAKPMKKPCAPKAKK